MFIKSRRLAVLAAASTLVAASASQLSVTQAQARSVAPGFAVDESFATGFMPDNGIGPVGVAADGSDIWVGDYAAGELYRFGPNGGLANQSTRVTANPIRARLAGLTFGRDGRLYAALQDTGKVVELSKADGRVLRTVADGLPNATGLATDPLTGDLFVTQPGSAPGVKRIKNLSPGSVAVKTWYTNAAPPGQNGNEVDGISFGRDGAMYLSSSTQIFRVEGANKASPARTSAVASVQNGDGIAVAAGKIASQPPYLLANRTDGTITKIDLTDAPPHKQTDIVTGGSRGDFATVGNDGCLYATQSDSVIKLTEPCDLEPPFCEGADGAPLRHGDRNPMSGSVACETAVFGSVATTSKTRALTGGYATRLSNVMTGDLAGGAAIHGCRTTKAGGTFSASKPRLRANNLNRGLAFEFNATLGLLGEMITVGEDPSVANVAARPFTTNATGVATGLNADQVDGKHASELGPSDIRVANQSSAAVSVPACTGTSLSACPELLRRTLGAGNWLVQAKLAIDNNANIDASPNNRCGLVQGTTELDKSAQLAGPQRLDRREQRARLAHGGRQRRGWWHERQPALHRAGGREPAD